VLLLFILDFLRLFYLPFRQPQRKHEEKLKSVILQGGSTEVNDQEKRLHQKKPNGVIPFGLIFLSVLSNLFSVDFRETCAKLATTNRQKILEFYY